MILFIKSYYLKISNSFIFVTNFIKIILKADIIYIIKFWKKTLWKKLLTIFIIIIIIILNKNNLYTASVNESPVKLHGNQMPRIYDNIDFYDIKGDIWSKEAYETGALVL